MRFYGGREINDEDLERALLVGLSSHERKRLKKKRDLSLKKNKADLVPGKEKQLDGPTVVSIAEDRLKVGASDGGKEGELSMTGNRDYCSNFDSCTDSVTELEAPACIEKDMDMDETEASSNKDVCAVNDDDDVGETGTTRNGMVDIHRSVDNGTIEPKHKSKLSLLGHGPHGKQVVDRILEEYGEDGIREFCQRWRQVFVEATQPRFLPAGWDIKHRYLQILTFYMFGCFYFSCKVALI